jgi:hypothetical protein
LELFGPNTRKATIWILRRYENARLNRSKKQTVNFNSVSGCGKPEDEISLAF